MKNSNLTTMRRIAVSLICPLIGALLMTSCLRDGEITEPSSAVALLSFEIKDLKTKHTVQKDDGTDSTYTTIVSGKTVAFTIDQTNHLVYNADSIAFGTDVAKVLVNVKADGGICYLKPDGEPASVEDSIDFTSPVTFRVTSYDTRFARDYKVSLNVHQVDPQKTEWREIVGANFPKGLFVEQKAFIADDRMVVLGVDNEGNLHTAWAPMSDLSAWTSAQCSGIDGKSDAMSAMLVEDVFYLTTDAGLYRSEDAVAWSVVDASASLSCLLAVENDMAWAMTADGFASSLDMKTWTSIGQWPKEDVSTSVASFTYPLRTNEDIKRTLFVAIPEAVDTCAQVWSKLSTEKDWVEVEPVGDNAYGCPNLEHLVVIRYADNLYAFGGQCVGERKKFEDAFGKKYVPFSTCFESLDHGVTWKPTSKGFSLNKEFKGRTDSFSAATDGEFVWVMWGDGDVWSGRWNGL